jgi:hypothetical protein
MFHQIYSTDLFSALNLLPEPFGQVTVSGLHLLLKAGTQILTIEAQSMVFHFSNVILLLKYEIIY